MTLNSFFFRLNGPLWNWVASRSLVSGTFLSGGFSPSIVRGLGERHHFLIRNMCYCSLFVSSLSFFGCGVCLSNAECILVLEVADMY